ncbi:MAG: hypothetical protein EB127_20660 [Alphaproteobacteria bacterium]|nr:hypothetical protein [Alphaproteobacteria bacterium]
MDMRLEKIEEGEEVEIPRILDYIDCGDFYLLTELRNMTNSTVMITLNQNTVLEDLQKKHGGKIWYTKYCKITFCVYESEKRVPFSLDIDEVMNWTRICTFEFRECRILKALITRGELNMHECIVRWPNENGGRGEYWYKLVEKQGDEHEIRKDRRR